MPVPKNFRRIAALLSVATALAAATAVATAAPPAGGQHSINIAATPTTVTFGKSATISGVFSGTETANQKVSLEASDFPFSGAFRQVQKGTTAADGSYTFTVTPALATKYRVTGTTKHSPQTVSPDVLVQVRYKISLAVNDRTPKAGQRVLFSGTVLPAHAGRKVALQRKTPTGRWKTVSTATLVAAGDSSTYSKSLRVLRTGRYRALLGSDADHVRNHTGARLLRVHR